MDDIIAKYKTALSQIELIIKIECHGPLISKNRYFDDTLNKIKSQLNEAELEADAEPVAWTDLKGKSYTRNMISVSKLKESHTNKSRLKRAVDELHSFLVAYHKVASKRVVDNIAQNVDYFLLTGENSALKILTPMYISSLSNEKLEQIAGEDMISKNKRRELNSSIAKWEEGMRVIRGQ